MQENDILKQSLDRLNPSQREAATNLRGPQLVIAGAGSGKTSMLTVRTALLLDSGILPERILSLTFTKKAANEMKQRIIALAGPEAHRITMGTFHSVFIQMIRPYIQVLGFRSNFTILDEDDADKCLKRCIRTVLEKNRAPVEMRTEKQTKSYAAEDTHYKPKDIKTIISLCKNNLETPEHYETNERYKQRDEQKERPKVAEIFKEYRDTCFRNNMMDFDDILLYTDMLMNNHPDIRREIASHFDYIMVDEYQDTNYAQYSILEKLTLNNKNICVVGDDSQSIYAFRGADIRNIMNFTKTFDGARTVKLERNYRSTRTIVEMANNLISHNTRRLKKKCYSEAEEGDNIEIIENDNEKGEAAYIAGCIAADKQKYGLNYRDFAILYRLNSQSRALEQALINKHIPYVIYSGTSFFDRTEIKDQMAYFKLAVNPYDDESFIRIMNKPARGIGEATTRMLSELARINGMPIWQLLNTPTIPINLKPKAAKGLSELMAVISTGLTAANTMTAYDAADAIFNSCGIMEMYAKEEENGTGNNRGDNLKELLNAVKSYEEELEDSNRELEEKNRMPSTLAGFLVNSTLLSNADTKSDGDAVNLMTVHCAKGLEFEEVYVAGLEKNMFPLCIDKTEFELEEERRLFYVAMTRAKKRLIVTFAKNRLVFGQRKDMKESQFLNEMENEEIS